ncbi:reverse transcriptase domain-containing protein [Tanacetum coccineum]
MATNEETNAMHRDTDTLLLMLIGENGPTPHPMITDPPTTDSAAVPAPREEEYLIMNSPMLLTTLHLLLFILKSSLTLLLILPNDALMATMTQIANLLSGFQKQFPPTNNQLRTSSNSKTHATVYDGQIVTEPIQRKAPGNVGNTGARGKKVICYNCRGEGHVARQCKEPKRKMDSQYFKDKALLMEAKEKGDVLDAEAEAFLD